MSINSCDVGTGAMSFHVMMGKSVVVEGGKLFGVLPYGERRKDAGRYSTTI
jgi:hypothetical protein